MRLAHEYKHETNETVSMYGDAWRNTWMWLGAKELYLQTILYALTSLLLTSCDGSI
jgi:hypothetical protein